MKFTPENQSGNANSFAKFVHKNLGIGIATGIRATNTNVIDDSLRGESLSDKFARETKLELEEKMIGKPNEKDPILIKQLHEAIVRKDVGAVQDLINQETDFKAKNNLGYAALYTAAKCGHIEIVQYLMTAGFDIHAVITYGHTALRRAAEFGYIKLEAGSNVNDAHIEIVQYLTTVGANVNTVNKDDETPLRTATVCNKLKIAQLLINAGADVNAVNKKGQTLLHAAIVCDNLKIAQLLINAGADVNAVNKKGQTPLHEAAKYYNAEAVFLLDKNGVDVNAVDKDGQTPLCKAVNNCYSYNYSYNGLNNGYLGMERGDGVLKKGAIKVIQSLIIAGSDAGNPSIKLIRDVSIARIVNIAKVVQNLCKSQGHKNTIKLVDITDEERDFAKKIIINYLIKNGMPNNFCKHLEEFAPIELIKKDVSDDISISYDIRELLEERLLQIEVLEYCLHEMNKNLETKFSATTTLVQESGSYLLSMIKTKEDMSSIKNVSMLNKFMFYQFMNSNGALKYQVEELTKCIFPADKQDIQQLLIKELKALNAYKLLLTPEDYKEAALFFATEDESLVTDGTEGKPTKVLDKILDNEENLLEALNSGGILEKALTGDFDHAD